MTVVPHRIYEGNKLEEITEIINAIKKNSPLTEPYHVTTFRSELEGVGRVEVEIHDRGEDDNLRYGVVARTLDLDTPLSEASNAEESIEDAVIGARLHEFYKRIMESNK